MSSACIRWATQHLESFNALLTRQLSSVQRGTSIWTKCVGIVREYAEMLTEVGVDFTELIARGLDDENEREEGEGEKPMTRSESLMSGSGSASGSGLNKGAATASMTAKEQ